jgi:hypothetical protein
VLPNFPVCQAWAFGSYIIKSPARPTSNCMCLNCLSTVEFTLKSCFSVSPWTWHRTQRSSRTCSRFHSQDLVSKLAFKTTNKNSYYEFKTVPLWI